MQGAIFQKSGTTARNNNIVIVSSRANNIELFS